MEQYGHVRNISRSLGYDRLLPLQEKAFRMPELYDPSKNIFVTGNTSSGKTLIPLLHYILEREKNPAYKMLFLVPYRALAAQKKLEIEELLHKKFSELNVCVSTGELRDDDRDVRTGLADVAIVIYEKAYHFACCIPDFLKRYHTVVYDEFALSEDEQRGVACDLMLLQGMSSSCRLFILSTPHYSWGEYIHGGNFTPVQILERENRTVVPREEIPIFLDRCAKGSKAAEFHDYNKRPLGMEKVRERGSKNDLIEDLCAMHLERGHRILVFMNNCQEVRRMANELGRRLQKKRPELLHPLGPDEDEDWCFRNVLDETGLLEEDLVGLMDPQECVLFRQGIAYHNSWLRYELRTLVEKELLTDTGCLNVVFSTETMAYGINSSVDVVIVADMHKNIWEYRSCRRPDKNGRMKARTINREYTAFLKVNEYQNYIGRAGRYGRTQKGYAYALMTQTPGKSDIRSSWDKLMKQRDDPPRARSTLLKLDAYCNWECERKDHCAGSRCQRCSLYADEFAMPVLSLIPPEGITFRQIRERLLWLPGIDKNMSWLDRNIENALRRLAYRTGPARWVRAKKNAGPEYSRRYYLTKAGRAVCGMLTTMYECDCLRKYLFGQQAEVPDKMEPRNLLRLMTLDPFDLFYELCVLPELRKIAEDFFGINDSSSSEGRKWLSVYNDLCTRKLSAYYNTRKKCISLKLYERLTIPSGNRRVYRITNPFDTYRLLLAITIYEWYRTASIRELDKDLNSVPGTVVITTGRISHLTQQTSFYLQILAAMCDTMLDPAYEEIKALLLRMELCLYFGIRESNATVIPVEELRQLTRRQQSAVSRIMEFCSNSPPAPIRGELTKRQIRDWKQLLHTMSDLPADGTAAVLLKKKYPILVEAEQEFKKP